ncbi:Uncharacterised protein [Salmonella enterica subsp. enterica serovar Bovismorbificans]|nr:Uncharacterised protein [Salmonella enterica subsp. enterica serovar Bovismorbificans]
MIYSHTVSPSGVTSNRRPNADSQIKVLPFASRCALPIYGEKNAGGKISRYCQVIALVCGSNSSTVECGEVTPGRRLPLSKTRIDPLSISTGVCCCATTSGPACQITFPLSLSTAMTPEVVRRLISTRPSRVTDRPLIIGQWRRSKIS